MSNDPTDHDRSPSEPKPDATTRDALSKKLAANPRFREKTKPGRGYVILGAAD